MKKLIVLTLLLVAGIMGVANAGGDYLSSDPTVRKILLYGDNEGVPTPMKVGSDGELVSAGDPYKTTITSANQDVDKDVIITHNLSDTGALFVEMANASSFRAGQSPDNVEYLTANTLKLYFSADLVGTYKVTVGGGSGGGTGTPWGENAGNVYRSSGNVGIGTDAPSAKLEVNGDVKVSGEFISGGLPELNVKYFGAVCDGVTDDTTAIQSALTQANMLGGGIVIIPGNVAISSELTVFSNTTIKVSDFATVSFTAGSSGAMLNNKASFDIQRNAISANINNGSTNLTASSALFTSDDVGRSVIVSGASYSGEDLCAEITSYSSTTSVTINAEAQTSVSNADIVFYDRDSDITIIGGIWDRGSATGSGNDVHTMLLRRIDNLKIIDVEYKSEAAKYSISLGDVNNSYIKDVFFNDTNSQ